MPDRVLAPRDLNPAGFWEPVDAVRINHEFLFQHYDASLDQLAALESDIRCSLHDKDTYVSKIRQFLARCPVAPILVIKENDIPVFLSFWSEAAQLEQLDLKVVLCVRHPQEVMKSWLAWGSSTPVDLDAADPRRLAFIEILWLGRNIIMERASRETCRVIVSYSKLLEDGAQEMARISEKLSVNLQPDQNLIRKFLDPDLHTKKPSDRHGGERFSAWTYRLFTLMSEAAQDNAIDVAALNSLHTEYLANPDIPRLIDSFRGPIDIEKAMSEIDTWPVWSSGHDF